MYTYLHIRNFWGADCCLLTWKQTWIVAAEAQINVFALYQVQLLLLFEGIKGGSVKPFFTACVHPRVRVLGTTRVELELDHLSAQAQRIY